MKNFKWMQSDDDVELTHEGREFLVCYTYDADLGRSWITAIRDLDVEEIPALDLKALPAGLMAAAERAKENQETSQAERAHERLLADGPSESYESIQARNRLAKDGWS